MSNFVKKALKETYLQVNIGWLTIPDFLLIDS